MSRSNPRPHVASRGQVIGMCAALIVLFVMTADARAGQYVVVQCHPTYNGGAAHFNQQAGGPQPTHLKFFRSCSDATKGMGVFEEGAATAGNSWGSLNWWAPPGTHFTRVEFQNRRTGGEGWSTWVQTDNQFVSLHPANNTWDGRQTTLAEFRAFAVFLSCDRGEGCPHNNAHNHVRRLWFTVNDLVAPNVSLGGELLEGGIRRGVETLQLDAADAAPGLVSASIAVNGKTIERIDWRLSCRLDQGLPVSLIPCPVQRSTKTDISTELSPWVNGINNLTVCVRDIGGNERCVDRLVSVDNTCPSSGGAPAVNLQAGIEVSGNSKPTERAVLRSNQNPLIRGRVTGEVGNPISGAAVCVFETVELADASPELIAIARTGLNGQFATYLDAGPSRRLSFVYRYNNQVLTDSANIGSVVVPTLRVEDSTLTNGDNARFRGRLPGPNADNRAIVLQARVGRKWRTFKQIRSSADGRYRGLYRFTQTQGAVRYVFRARVKRQGGYPYLPGGSKKRRVLVRG